MLSISPAIDPGRRRSRVTRPRAPPGLWEHAMSRARQDQAKAAETRLQRLREIIEGRAKAGLDTGEGWRLFQLTASALASLRQTHVLLDALDQAHGPNVEPILPDLAGFERMRFGNGTD